MNNINFVAFDFETATKDRLPCSLGIAVVENGVIVEKKYFLFRPPNNYFDKNTIKVHKITPDQTENLPEFDHYWNEIKKYFHHNVIVAHNLKFDTDALKNVLEVYNITDKIIPLAQICTMNLYNGKGLEDVCTALDIEFTNHHNALADAVACAKIFIKYLNGTVLSDLTYPKSKRVRFYNFNKYTPTEEDLKYVDEISKEFQKDNINELFFLNTKIVYSGDFKRFPNREELKATLESLGGKCTKSLSGKTNFFVVGTDFGNSKLQDFKKQKAVRSNIALITEEQLYIILKLINEEI